MTCVNCEFIRNMWEVPECNHPYVVDVGVEFLRLPFYNKVKPWWCPKEFEKKLEAEHES